jgi:hypothetical protein
MPENALSTEAVDVEMVFLTAIKVVKFGSLFGFIGRPINQLQLFLVRG